MNYLRTIFRGCSRPLLAGSFVFALLVSMTVPVQATVFTNPALITINDPTTTAPSNPYPSTIAVSGMTGTITSMTVTLINVNHTFIPDVDCLLVGPTSANMIIMSDVSSGNDLFNTTVTLDDAAAGTISAAGTLTTGTYKPTNTGAGDVFPAPAPVASANTTFATAFNGTDPNGNWSLYTQDDVAADIGSLGNGWSLTITTTGSPATTFTNGAAIKVGDAGKGKATPYASTIAVSGMVGAITDVNVTITNLNHSFPDDIDILLVSSTGKRLIIMSDTGGSNILAGVNVTFDDAAAATLPDSTAIATGSFRPTNIGGALSDFFPEQLTAYPSAATAASSTLASVFNGTEPNGTWSLYVIDDAGGQPGTIMGGWSLDITAGGTYGAKRFTSADFEGDGRTDISVWRQSSRQWFWRESTALSNRAYPTFGLAADLPVPGDYDGDRKADVAVYRPSNGTWYIVQSGTGTLRQEVFGGASDTPVQADYDGDGKFDVAVYRGGASATWYILRSATSTQQGVVWGTTNDVPVAGHFEGTNGADFTVYRPSETRWYILNNATSSSRSVTLGAAGDTLAPADYDGDGKTDVAVWRDTDGNWYGVSSSTGSGFGAHWGQSGDTPVPGDYDGDSRADLAVWRASTGQWFMLNSGTPVGTSAVTQDNWGQTGDKPIPRLYLPNP